MTEERLEEIKESIEFQKNITMIRDYDRTFIDEELELYNEVVKLRKIIDKANNFVKQNEVSVTYYMRGFGIENRKQELLDILKQHNLTLEQLTDIAND